MNGRFVINRNRAKVMGVCAGLADWLNVDVLAVRLGVIIATLMTGPVAVLIYILTGWLASVPLVGHLGSGEGAEIRAPMAMAVITGLVSSTILTLVVVPTVYALVCRRSSVGAVRIAAGPELGDDLVE